MTSSTCSRLQEHPSTLSGRAPNAVSAAPMGAGRPVLFPCVTRLCLLPGPRVSSSVLDGIPILSLLGSSGEGGRWRYTTHSTFCSINTSGWHREDEEVTEDLTKDCRIRSTGRPWLELQLSSGPVALYFPLLLVTPSVPPSCRELPGDFTCPFLPLCRSDKGCGTKRGALADPHPPCTRAMSEEDPGSSVHKCLTDFKPDANDCVGRCGPRPPCE